MAHDLTKSTSNLNELTHNGRPRGEDPHVKRSTKKKEEKVEYIVRVDLEELKIDDDCFEDLQSLYKLLDLDKDGILNFKEFEKLMRCLGYRLTEPQAQELATSVSVDKTNFSVSFNEFLKLFSQQQQLEPDEETLVDVFASFDKEHTGKISEKVFKQIMLGKGDVSETDIDEMLQEYYRIARLKGITTAPGVPGSAAPPPPETVGDGSKSGSRGDVTANSGATTPKPPPIPQPAPPPTRNPPTKAVTSPQSPTAKKRTSRILSPTSDTSEAEKYIDYKEFAAMLQQ